MSVEVRQELAAAAASVPGISAHPFHVQGTRPGHTYVRLERIDYPNPFGGLRRWNVVVVLPQDQAKAEEYLEDKLPALLEALSPHLAIRDVVPQRLGITGVGDLLCVFINGQREE